MTVQQDVRIIDVPLAERPTLDWILDQSFEGWYQRHSKGILRHIETVRVAKLQEKAVGLVMLKRLEEGSGYVYYIAVASAYRQKGIAGTLLDDALRTFNQSGVKEVFASVEEDNAPSEALFASRGFVGTSFRQVSKRYGSLHAANMYREMMVIPGEVLLRRSIG